MHPSLTRLAGPIFFVGTWIGIEPAAALEPAPQAYVNQLDQTGFGTQPQLGGDGSVYVDQLSPLARPMAQRKKSVSHREDHWPAVEKQKIPDVGSGVSLALSPAKRDDHLPNVGRGVVR